MPVERYSAENILKLFQLLYRRKTVAMPSLSLPFAVRPVTFVTAKPLLHRTRVGCLIGLIFVFVGCITESVPSGRILVKNDSLDSEYNVITVSGGGAFASLRPGERTILPRGTTAFSVERRYRDYTRSYSVRCPKQTTKGIAMKLIDIHVNRMPGGCKTISAKKH